MHRRDEILLLDSKQIRIPLEKLEEVEKRGLHTTREKTEEMRGKKMNFTNVKSNIWQNIKMTVKICFPL